MRKHLRNLEAPGSLRVGYKQGILGTSGCRAPGVYLVVQYFGELKVNLWDYKGILLPPKRLKGYLPYNEVYKP